MYNRNEDELTHKRDKYTQSFLRQGCFKKYRRMSRNELGNCYIKKWEKVCVIWRKLLWINFKKSGHVSTDGKEQNIYEEVKGVSGG